MTTAIVPSTSLALIEQAVLALAKRCDGAHELDGAGFNRWDTDWGHAAATEIQQGGHVDPVRGLRVVSKYRRQLAGDGITLPDMPTLLAEIEAAKPVFESQPAVVANEHTTGGLRIALVESLAGTLGQQLALYGTYPNHTEAVKALPKRKWAPELEGKPWLVPASFISQVALAFPGAHLSPEVQELVGQNALEVEARRKAEAEAEAARVVALDSALARYELILSTLERKPFAHQDTGIRWLIETRYAILADDMGLGKTYQALVAARALNHRIIVVAPAGLRVNWLREAENVSARIEVYSWAKLPQPIKGAYTLIADEAHYAQNMKAKRTKAFLALADAASAVFELTGTPIKNGRPANLFPLLVGIKHPLAKNRSAYERRYCEAKATRWTRWDVTGAAHLEELHGLIADGLLRRMKEECLDLPGKMRVVRDIRSELSVESQARYQTAFDSMQADYQRRKALGEIDEADALVMLNHLRHASSLAKVEASIEMAEEVIEQGGQVVLFTAFLDSAKEIATALKAGRITGEEDSATRQSAIDAFQAGVTKALVCTLGAGNVGITLTSAQTVILVDRPWTPGDALQAEDRLYRIGQKSSVLAIWLEATDSDVGMDALLENKYRKSETVITGAAPELCLIGDHARFAGIDTIKQLALTLFGNDA